ncbi:hypothetical protein BD626DRAFT_391500 [Schizophyllum amplum]|uniref:Uncharacterized protein n=1 Tax=Schizophyllum amplum TaxID=97359 RepID=A0A550D035_9AGAR|nr:hypothetical protein BD626DRAFT_391500 [Auriculariopsis ampla]
MRLSAVALSTLVSAALAAPRPRQEYCDMKTCLNDLRAAAIPACEALESGTGGETSAGSLSDSAIIVRQVLCLQEAYTVFEYTSLNCEPCMEELSIPDEDEFDEPYPGAYSTSFDSEDALYQVRAAENALIRAEQRMSLADAHRISVEDAYEFGNRYSHAPGAKRHSRAPANRYSHSHAHWYSHSADESNDTPRLAQVLSGMLSVLYLW